MPAVRSIIGETNSPEEKSAVVIMTRGRRDLITSKEETTIATVPVILDSPPSLDITSSRSAEAKSPIIGEINSREERNAVAITSRRHRQVRSSRGGEITTQNYRAILDWPLLFERCRPNLTVPIRDRPTAGLRVPNTRPN